MIINLGQAQSDPANLFRRAGYVFKRKEGEEWSFERALSRSGYPRFHAFVHIKEGNLVAKLHLDQKRNTYGTATRHHGEYEDSNLLNEEVARIKQSIL